MPEEPIARDIQEFIARHIVSVAELEALLLLHDRPDDRWTLAHLAERLYTGEAHMEAILSRLCSNGLVVRDPDIYRYEPTPAVGTIIDRLSNAYRGRLIAVTNLIHEHGPAASNVPMR